MQMILIYIERSKAIFETSTEGRLMPAHPNTITQRSSRDSARKMGGVGKVFRIRRGGESCGCGNLTAVFLFSDALYFQMRRIFKHICIFGRVVFLDALKLIGVAIADAE